MYFSSNVSPSLTSQISDLGHIPITDDMGIYLGVPTLHGWITKENLQFLLDKVKAKLSGWKARILSLAGRIMLAKSVLNSTPFYTMQTWKIPVTLLDEIDRVIRCFIWGHEVGSRKLHLIS